tara:strand:+ start:1 stop:2148 length:2148 start_codon:yes stop_codon:yes gene_type:complete
MSFMARAGFEVNEVMAASPHVLDLASAAGMDLAETADIVSQVIRGMNLEATEAQRVTDVLGLTAARTNTSVSQLGQAFGYVAPVASALGITLEQTAAMLGVLSNAGIQADRAGTGLKNIFAELAAEIDEHGISALERFTKGGIGVAEAFEIFQKRGGPAILALENMSATTDELIIILEHAQGTIREMNRIRMDTIEGAWKLVKSAVSDLQIEIAEKLEPTIRNVQESMRQAAVAMTGYVGEISAQTDGAIVSVEDMNKAFISIISGIRKVSRVVVALGSVIAGVFEALQAIVMTVFSAILSFVGGVQLAASGLLSFLPGNAGKQAEKDFEDTLNAMTALWKQTGKEWQDVGVMKFAWEETDWEKGLHGAQRSIDRRIQMEQRAAEVIAEVIDRTSEIESLGSKRQKLQQVYNKYRVKLASADNQKDAETFKRMMFSAGDEIVAVTEKINALNAANDAMGQAPPAIQTLSEEDIALGAATGDLQGFIAEQKIQLRYLEDTTIATEIWDSHLAGVSQSMIDVALALNDEINALEEQNKLMDEGTKLTEQHMSATDRFAKAEGRLNEMLSLGAIDERTQLLELDKLAKARDAALGVGKPDMGKAVEGIESAFGTVKMKAQFGGGAQSVAKQQLNAATQQLSSLNKIATSTTTMASTTGANSLGVQLSDALNNATFTVIGIDKQEELLREGNETRDSSLSELKKINAGVAAISSGGGLT